MPGRRRASLRDVPREKGEKIPIEGQGRNLDQWLTYGSEESLAFFAYREPRKAKSLHIGVIPRAVDEYLQFRGNYAAQEITQKLGNPVHHIHGGKVPAEALPLTYGLLLNLASLPGVDSKETAWKFVQRYAPGTAPDTDPELDNLIGLAVNYARDFVAPTLQRRAPVGHEIDALKELDAELAKLDPATPGDEIQNIVFEWQAHQFESLRHWFQALYETLLGGQGPRMGSFRLTASKIAQTDRRSARRLTNKRLYRCLPVTSIPSSQSGIDLKLNCANPCISKRYFNDSRIFVKKGNNCEEICFWRSLRARLSPRAQAR